MDNKYTVRISALDDVLYLSKNLRQDDINELNLQASTPFSSLLKGYLFSDECYTICVNNIPAGIFGLYTKQLPNKWGNIWFLGSDLMKQIPRAWAILGKKYINKFLNKCNILTNCVDIHNVLHINWLQHMGAIFDKPYDNISQFYIIKRIK